MKKIIAACLTAVVLAAGTTFAAGGDPSEFGVRTSALKIYSGGVGFGAMYPLNDEMKEDVGDVFAKISFVNNWEFMDNLALFADFNWLIAGSESLNHGGVDVGIDYFLSPHSFRPFVGAGVGAHYIGRKIRGPYVDHVLPPEELELADKFGLSLTAHAGFTFEVTESVLVRFRIPFHVVLNSFTDAGVGVDFSVMFTDKFRKIRQLNY